MVDAMIGRSITERITPRVAVVALIWTGGRCPTPEFGHFGIRNKLGGSARPYDNWEQDRSCREDTLVRGQRDGLADAGDVASAGW